MDAFAQSPGEIGERDMDRSMRDCQVPGTRPGSERPLGWHLFSQPGGSRVLHLTSAPLEPRSAQAKHGWPANGARPDHNDDKLLFALSLGASLVAAIGLLIFLLVR